MSVSTSRVNFLGWNFGPDQGQFEVDKESLVWYFDRRDLSVILPPNESHAINNRWACIPLLNVVCGTMRIFSAILADRKMLLIKQEDELACRFLLVCMGILEITLIGGVIVHGFASIYFAWTREPSQQQV